MPQEVQKHNHQAARIETLVQEVAAFPDPRARATAEELVQVLLDMYGEGLARLLEITAETEASGLALIDTFASDELLSSLFLLHGLHPLDIETRIMQALDEVRPYLKSHGGNVEFVRVEGGVAHLRLQGSCHGCPSSTITLKSAIEEAIYKAAPDLDDLQVEGVTEPPARPGIPMTFVPPRRHKDRTNSAQQDGGWRVVEGLQSLAEGGLPVPQTGFPQGMPLQVVTVQEEPGGHPQGMPLQVITVQEEPVLFCQIGDTYYAYHNRCGNCNAPLDGGRLEETTLTCSSCGRQYDVCHAGRCLDAPNLFLEPIPLLMEGGTVKVALSALAKDDRSEATLSTSAR
jgi:Fe-S cluster biogenesis protein NfuA/nitrite reductase/ring-hydroxylating ferredoxin subunit